MTQKKLFELLSLIGSINIRNRHWEMIRKIVNCINSDDTTIIEANWLNFKRGSEKYYPLGKEQLADIKTWSTHDNGSCILIKFKNDNGKLYCECTIADGRPLNGHRTEDRFIVKMYLPNKFIKEHLTDTIDYRIEQYASDCYDDYLERKRSEWMVNFKNELLK